MGIVRDLRTTVARALLGPVGVEPGTVGAQLLSGVISAGGQAPPRRSGDYLKSYSSMPWLRAVASRVSYDIAATDWHVYVRRRDGAPVRDRQLQRAKAPRRHQLVQRAVASGELQEIETHPVIDLLDDFNPMQTGLMGRRVTQLHLDLVGEAFWLLQRGTLGQPEAIWPVPPNWVLSTPSVSEPFFRVSFRGWQGAIPATEWIWFVDIDPANPYGRGTGTSQALADELETDEYTAKHIKAFYFNRARPDLIVSPKGEGVMQPSEVDRLEESWTRHSGGFWRAFRPFFLRRGVEVKELAQSFQNQQLVQLREFERDTILQTFGVSPETLGILSSGSNRATVTMGDVIYAKRVLVPRLELLRTVMQERLLPLFDERLVIDYESPVVRDKELELEAAKAAPWAASVDEWRHAIGLAPLMDEVAGQTHMGPVTVAPVTFAPETPAPTDEGEDAEDELDEDGDEAEEARLAGACLKAGDAASAEVLTKEPDDEEPAATQLAERQVAAYRRAQEAAWAAVAARPSDEALRRAMDTRQVDAVVEAFGGMAAIERAFGDVLEAKAHLAFMRGAELALRSLPAVPQREPVGIDLAAINPEAVRWARQQAARLVRNVSPEVRQVIADIIVTSTEGKLTPQQAARLIRRRIALLKRDSKAVTNLIKRLSAQEEPLLSAERIFAQAERYAKALLRKRAMLIARTELVGAVNGGQQALWEQARNRGVLPKQMERVWLVTLDDAVDTSICLPLSNARAPFGQPFPGGYMHPPAHPGCRCAVGLASPRKAVVEVER